MDAIGVWGEWVRGVGALDAFVGNCVCVLCVNAVGVWGKCVHVWVL